jgi:hypothetical protein
MMEMLLAFGFWLLASSGTANSQQLMANSSKFICVMKTFVLNETSSP